MRKGWFKLPGQEGDRTLEEQIFALQPALAECKGKTVLDMGCAEGLISFEFAKAGATRVLGIDVVYAHLEVANSLKGDLPVEFKRYNLKKVRGERAGVKFDIVLALGVIHKMDYPIHALEWAARSCNDLLLLRSGLGARNGIIKGKHSGITCDSHAVLKREGFKLEKTEKGSNGHHEDVEYWRKIC